MPARRTTLRLSNALTYRLEAAARAGIDVDPSIRRPSLPELDLDGFLEAVSKDARIDQDRLLRLWSVLPESERPAELPRLAWDARLQARAVARPDRSVVISVGMVLAIEETLLAALTNVAFFDLLDDAPEWQGAEPVMCLRRPETGPRPVNDFGWLRDDPGSGPSSFIARAPLDPWRLCQFELLRDLAIHWLYLHETAHVVDGHIGLQGSIARRLGLTGESEIGLGDHGCDPDGFPPTAAVRRATHARDHDRQGANRRKAFELQADHLGFIFLAQLHAAKPRRGTSAFVRMRRRLSGSRLSPSLAPLLRLRDTHRIRALIVAAGSVMLVVEKLSRLNGRSPGYPLPLARLMSLQLAVLALSDFVRSGEQGIYLDASAADHPGFAPFLRAALLAPFIDLDVVAKHLGLAEMLIPNVDGSGTVGIASIVNDLMTWFGPTHGLESFATEEARELFSLLDEVLSLKVSCAPYRTYELADYGAAGIAVS